MKEHYCGQIILAGIGLVPPIAGQVRVDQRRCAVSNLPESAVIVGGSVIGIEFATLCAGPKVTVLEMMDEILPGMGEACPVLKENHVAEEG